MSWKNYIAVSTLLSVSFLSTTAFAQDIDTDMGNDYDVIEISTDNAPTSSANIMPSMPDLATNVGAKMALSYSDKFSISRLAERWNLDYSGIVGVSVGSKPNSPLVMGLSHDFGLEALYLKKIDDDTLLEVGLMDRSLDGQSYDLTDLPVLQDGLPDITEGAFYGASITRKQFNIVAGYEGNNYGFVASSFHKGNVSYKANLTTDGDAGVGVSHQRDFNKDDLSDLKLPLHSVDVGSYASLHYDDERTDLGIGVDIGGERQFNIMDQNVLFDAGVNIDYRTLSGSFNVRSQMFLGAKVAHIKYIDSDLYVGVSMNEKSEANFSFRVR